MKDSLPWEPRNLVKELIWQAAPPLAFLLGMLRFFPYWNSFWLVYDEGYEVMKAMLVVRGFGLYSQIWDDQAPLVTYSLAGLFRGYGYNIDLSRKLILVLSCVMVWAVVQYLRLAWGNLHAWIGAALLALLPNFLVVSAAILVGQPSLTFAALSMLALAGWHLRRRKIFILLSAAALSLSLLSKLFTAFLVPIFLLGLLIPEYLEAGRRRDWIEILRPAFLWGLSLAGLTLGLGLLMISPASAWQLFQPHLSASQSLAYPANEQLNPINYHLRPAWPVLLAAAIGAVYAWRQKRWLMAYPLAWMAAAYVSLLIIKPVWWHHQMLVTIPAAMLAAGAVGESLAILYQTIRGASSLKKSWPLLTAGLVSLALILALRVPDTASFLRNAEGTNTEERNPAEEKFMRKIIQFAPQTNWMITDMPMFPFRAGLAVPPNLAVISWKRFAAGDLTEAEILQTMQERQPEQVLFGRFTLSTVEQYLSKNYRMVLQREATKLYIRNDLQK